ncbi:MAG: peptidylprolyl isomerase [Bacteroidota bacterium]|nr:peptidylprolyl isomerase [Bacteroidota bacterium]
MGLITSIRKRLWVVTIIMALALLGFIVMDMTTGNSGLFFKNPNTVGEAAGQKLEWKEFQNTERILYNNSNVDPFGRKQYIWEQFVDKALLDKEAEYNGMGISPAEVSELQFGNFLSPIVQRNFRDPNTGQVNREQLNQFKQWSENESFPQQELKDFWEIQTKEIIKDRMFYKLNNIIVKSLYMPDFMLDRNHKDGNTKIDFAYMRVSYKLIEDSLIQFTDADLQAYIKEHSNQYMNEEEVRNLKYVVFNLIPTTDDSANIRKILENKKEAFIATKEDSSYVTTNLGVWDETFLRREKLSPMLSDTVFKVPIGTVLGPYIEDGEYRMTKVLGNKVLPDSVKSRHILRRVATQAEYAGARALLDSIKTVIEKGQGKFETLATEFSQDVGSGIKGGDLGWAAEGMMVKEFNDLIFFKAQKGELNIVPTQFGLHLIEVTDQRFMFSKPGVRIATLSETISPGDVILDQTLVEAQDLIQNSSNLEDLEKKVKESKNLTIEFAPGLTRNTFKLTKLGEAGNNIVRDLSRWAFSKEGKVGQISPEVYSMQDDVKKYTNKYLIAGLYSICPKGLACVDAVRDEVELEVKNKKKAEKIIKEMGTVSDLTGTYGPYEVPSDTARDISVLGGFITGGGDSETAVVAHVMKLKPGDVSKPLEGKQGVYILKLLDRRESGEFANKEVFRQFYSHIAKNTAMTYLLNDLRKKNKIKDLRYNFY